MRMCLSSAFSNSVLGGLAAWIFLSGSGLLLWAAAIAWGCFFHTGGNTNAVRITVAGTCLGIVSGWTAGLLLLVNPIGVTEPVWAGLVVFGVVFVMVFVGFQMGEYLKLSILVVPASFYGIAATFAYMTQVPKILSHEALLSVSIQNPLIVMPISMVIGAFLGLATAKMTHALAASPTAVPNPAAN
jgi:Protein of unknown function (DUF1097)